MSDERHDGSLSDDELRTIARLGPDAIGSPDAGDDADNALPCVRCGHDLRGERLQWTTSCPLRGRCPECGLEFAWATVVSEADAPPAWSVEARGGVLRWIGRWGLTNLVGAFATRVAFRSLGMHHRRRFGRLAIALAVWFVAVMVVHVAVTSHVMYQGWLARTSLYLDGSEAAPLRVGARVRCVLRAAFPFTGSTMRLPRPAVGSVWTQTDLGWVSCHPESIALSFASPESMRAVFDGDGALWLVGRRRGDYTEIDWSRNVRRPTAAEEQVYQDAFERAVADAVPLEWPNDGVDGIARIGGGLPVGGPLPAGEVVAVTSVGPWTLRPSPARQRVAEDGFRFLVRVHPIATIAVAVSIAMFAALPIARRRAKVQWGHVLRIGAYLLLGAWTLAWLPWGLLPQASVGGMIGRIVQDPLYERIYAGIGSPAWMTHALAPLPIVLVGAVWLTTAWVWAARWYLRMDRPGLVGMSVAVPSVLVTWILVLVWPW